MEYAKPSTDQWRRLYDLAANVYALAPWEHLEETDVFGVDDPASKQTNFVSIMGSLGEHLAVSVYLGEPGLRGFWQMIQQSDVVPELLLETPQLQLSFEDREELTTEDRAVIKALGLKFRGRQAWPMFRSIRPGYFPWRLTADEAGVLETALSQLLEVGSRLQDLENLRLDLQQFRFLVRASRGEGAVQTWHDVVRTIAIPEAPALQTEIPRDLVDRVRALAKTIQRIQVGMEVMTGFGEERSEPVHVAYCLLAVDPKSGTVLGHDIFGMETTVEAMYGTVGRRILKILLTAGVRPLAVELSSKRLASVLQPVLTAVQCEVKLRLTLPQCERVMESLRAFLSR